MNNLILIDGSSLAFRAFYALFNSQLKSKTGIPTGAIYVFFNSILDIIEKFKPEHMAICFDLSEPTFRHIKYPEYKANRNEMPEDLALQWPLIKEGVKLLDVSLLEKSGFEADDLIGTYTRLANEKNYNVSILTGDQDAFQLIKPEYNQVLMPGKNGLITYGCDEVFQKLGVYPNQIIDYKALAGDSSDNIPGIKGIGPKTACELLQTHNNLDNLYNNLDTINKKGLLQKLIEGKDNAYLSRYLATIETNVPVEFDLNSLSNKALNYKALVEFLDNLNMRKLVSRIEDKYNLGPKMVVEYGQMKLNFDSSEITQTTFQSAQNNKIKLSPTNIIDDDESLLNLISKLENQSVIAIDLETDSVDTKTAKIVGIALAFNKDVKVENSRISRVNIDYDLIEYPVESFYIPILSKIENIKIDSTRVFNLLKPILENRSIFKIAQNAKFEINILANYGITLKPLIFDPMLASYIENSDNRHGLKDQVLRIFDYQMTHIENLIGTGKKQITMDLVPYNQIAQYAGDDARFTYLLALYYQNKLNTVQLNLLYNIELPLSIVIAKMERNGICLDIDFLKDLNSYISKELKLCETNIHKLANSDFNINSPVQLQKILFQDLGLQTKSKTKTGFSTDIKVLETLKDSHPIIEHLINYRHLQKLLSTYVETLPKQAINSRIHGQFNQVITSTGRLSSSNPNLQNIPIKTELGKKIRKAFVAQNKEDYILSADYSQIELRVLAHMSKDDNLIQAFENNLDIHALTSAKIYDCPIESVTNDMRRVGKTLNFALIYQQGAYSTAKDLGISVKEANIFIDKYFEQFPRVKTYFESVIQEAKKCGYVETFLGRRRYFHDLDNPANKASQRAACNAPIQGSAADLIKLAMVKLNDSMENLNLKSKLILQVHDELVLEVAKEELDTLIEIVLKSMTLDNPLVVPLKVDIEIGKSWYDNA